MSSLLRKSTALVHGARRAVPIRSFHSPFVVLGQTRRKVQSPQAEAANPFAIYEKQSDFSHEPLTPTLGNRTYVVSQPDASASHYEVPSGAYPTSSPYVNFAPAEAPDTNGAQVSSTSSSPAHEFTTKAAPQNFDGVGASSAIRYTTAPGEMGEQGGSFGGLAMMDRKGTVPGEGQLAERNPPPDGDAAEMFSKAGVDNAWKLRK